MTTLPARSPPVAARAAILATFGVAFTTGALSTGTLMTGTLLSGVVPSAHAARPSDLAPGAPELGEAELRLANLIATNRAVATATSRLQQAWALPPEPPPAEATTPAPTKKVEDPSKTAVPLTRVVPVGKNPCADTARLALGWRTERFGAAWRETAQAVRIQAERVHALRLAPTVSPLVDPAWAARLDLLEAEAQRSVAAYREGSVWQGRYVRPRLQACPAPPVVPAPGFSLDNVRAQGEVPPRTAILAQGDGWVCPAAVRADDGVVLLDGASACWSPGTPCACEPTPQLPGGVIGPESGAPNPTAPAPPPP